ncbi:MAG: glycosyltransferase family 4 protein [Candidatus Omnitrophota bacterium]
MADSKKILFIITYLELGGAQKQLLRLINGLPRDKYDIHLIAGHSGHLLDKFKAVPGLKIKLIRQLVRRVNPVLDIGAFIKIWQYIRKHKFDIVHTHSPKASMTGRWAARLAGAEHIVYTVHGWPFHPYMNPVFYHLGRLCEKVTAVITSKIIVVSHADLETGVKKVAGAGKFELIHYGLDTEVYERVYLERKSARQGEGFILNISALKRQKGLADFFRLVELMAAEGGKAGFVLVGNGPLQGTVMSRLNDKRFHGRVKFKGWVDDVQALLKRCSVLVLTSLWEGLPVAVIEAVLSGVPVVVTDTGGVRDIVADGVNGKIVRRHDARGMYDAVREIIGNYDEWSAKIVRYWDNLNLSYWSQERMVRQVEALYGSLLSRESPTTGRRPAGRKS